MKYRSLSLALFAAAWSFAEPAPAAAEPAPPATPATADDGLGPQDRDALSVAEHLALQTSQRIEQWLHGQETTEDRLFARIYFPIEKTEPQKFHSPYDALADRDLVAYEDKALGRSPAFQYAIITDSNAYIPAHNSRFAQPLTGDIAQDYDHNRTKRMLGDAPSLTAARSEARYLIQRVRLDNGDTISDLSVPVVVRGKHWGCARIGYRRAE